MKCASKSHITLWGVIGVSKACCLSCAIVLDEMNILGGRWRAWMLPGNSVLAAHIKKRVDAMCCR